MEKFREGYIDLTVTFRMPQKISELANEFSEKFGMNQELRTSKVERGDKLFHTEHIIWININKYEWLDYIYKSFKRLKKEGKHPSDIVFLLPDHLTGMEAVDFFRKKDVGVNHVFENEVEKKYHLHKKAFWMGDSRLKISTIHSFKGWELQNIVIYIPSKTNENVTKLDSIIYTAITRSQENLIVLNANERYLDFGNKFPKHWEHQSYVQT